MRSLLLVFALAACTEHGKGGPQPMPADPDEPPVECAGHCIIREPTSNTSDVCCDSVTCFIDESTGEWVVLFCDPEPEPIDPCIACTTDEICVQSFDGGCTGFASCVPRAPECPDDTCTPDCEAAYCNSPTQCQNSVPCGTESPLAFHCYGP